MGILNDFFGSNFTEYRENTGFRPGVLGLDDDVRGKLTSTQGLANGVTANRLAQISDQVGAERMRTAKLRRLAQRQLSIQEAQINQLEEQANFAAESAKNQLKYRRISTKNSQNIALHSLDVSLLNAENRGFNSELIHGSDSVFTKLGGW